MQLHELKPIHDKKRKKRVGRGGKRGTYSGRGIKGQKSRAGRKFVPVIRGLIKRYPKLRGYRFKSLTEKPLVINLEILDKKFKSGDSVNPQTLIERKLISKIKGRMPRVKILGKGKLTKALILEGCQMSKQAEEKIKKAGGTVKANGPR
ncbi:MAG: 50S ribosomal protein L15 [Candidatus Nealsonbacteria bacterium CG09_land_8_20_14_0_10_42_14]|uniref:Large ribosomal subunit protein uL15 n=1 Tax=Candidatus Nealsonbacteria bacterium CG09_land_8_20_14_0_10_42_14 TaxID=1974707 RepID=A0A2H0WXM4_9BACT|nr:MAG: 50S ribosomal protein L15 [Candidatus Nealsonbacteria bacterium CG09_land_8_20_14_0_10_42_14]